MVFNVTQLPAEQYPRNALQTLQSRNQKNHLGGFLIVGYCPRWKAKPFDNASHAKCVALTKVNVEAKQPNTAIHKNHKMSL
uniref:Uncharacterized protein n=1 Tax=Glossina palpalis gambiensis TaxID=67801 RepID=A0A1B0BJT2_9MUSC